MEVNKKLRGQKHHSNKIRYQNKAKVVPKTVPEKLIANKSKNAPEKTAEIDKGVTSNWDRYKELPDDSAADEFTNFSLLAQAPISHGGHFQFKSDKNVQSEFDFESLRNNKMFSLDLHLLDTSLSTIPFYERCGLDESYLMENQIDELNRRSRQNQAQYERYIRKSSVSKELLSQSINPNRESSKSTQKCDVKGEQQDIEVMLPSVLQLHTQQEISANREVSSVPEVKVCDDAATTDNVEGKEELEQWLDAILND